MKKTVPCPPLAGGATVGTTSARTVRSGSVFDASDPAALLKTLESMPFPGTFNTQDFRRASLRVKRHLLAAFLAVLDAGNELSSGTAVIHVSRSGAHEQNREYYEDYRAFGKQLARGQLFIGTLPSTPLCEVAILLGLHGPVYYLDTLDDPTLLREDIALIFERNEAPSVLLLTDEDDAPDESVRATIFLPGAAMPPEDPDFLPRILRTATRNGENSP